MFIEQPPWFFRALYPQAIFRMDPNERAVYLTFDDGPIPEVTPWVLELLKKHDIKATFFMVGDNIRKHPDEYRMEVEHGHRIGNHTFNHIRGFEYSNPDYLANTRRVDEIIHSDLFRPPHGHMGWLGYTANAADDSTRVELGGGRIMQKAKARREKKNKQENKKRGRGDQGGWEDNVR